MKTGRILTALHDGAKHVVLLPVYFYRKFISPMKGAPSCRFTPTCSQYAVEAVMEWGIIRGLALAIWRVLRCNPFGGCGDDPVPRRRPRDRRQ